MALATACGSRHVHLLSTSHKHGHAAHACISQIMPLRAWFAENQVAGTPFGPGSLALGLPNNSALTLPLSEAMITLRRNGYLDKLWRTNVTAELCSDSPANVRHTPISHACPTAEKHAQLVCSSACCSWHLLWPSMSAASRIAYARVIRFR